MKIFRNKTKYFFFVLLRRGGKKNDWNANDENFYASYV